MTITLKALGALLSYPTSALVEAMPEIRGVLADERGLSRRERRALQRLCDEIEAGDLIDVQERYVALFDRGRATSLHLFEHVHGDSRDRGQAMVDLHRIYAEAGLALVGNELPDYLPALLEFLSLQPFAVAVEMLTDSERLLRSVGEALVAQESPHAAVFTALLSLIGTRGLSAPREPRKPEKSLDEEWVEEPVLFGRGSACAAAPGAAPAVVRFVDRPPHLDQGVPR
jgi:nitrate reductase molybdenum cofactor assembly chaperone NarJ/NarW